MTEKRISSLLTLLVLTVMTAFGVSPEQAVERFVKASGLRPGSVAVKIVDLKDGKTVGEYNGSTPLVPASIMKSVTTAALLDKVGPDYRYHTQVYLDGPMDMGIVRGNLVIEGAMDPSLNSRSEPVSEEFVGEIVDRLKLLGIHKIEGRIIVDQSKFEGNSRPASWQKEDFKETYGTGSHSFNFESNSNGKFSVENPAKVFESRLLSRLAKEGILIDMKDLGDGSRERILDHVSAPIDEIMRSCMMRSDNLFAESMLRTYGKLNGGNGSTEEAAEEETEMWRKKKMPMEGVRIIDGSGLSRQNRVTADFMTSVLRSMSGNPYYASFFPLAGQEGTLKKFLAATPLDSYVAMKTGSMKGIQCYAGYKLDEDYVPTHAIVIMMNDITGSRTKAKTAAEKMLLSIFEQPTDNKDEERETE